jgi:hypothetical protein
VNKTTFSSFFPSLFPLFFFSLFIVYHLTQARTTRHEHSVLAFFRIQFHLFFSESKECFKYHLLNFVSACLSLGLCNLHGLQEQVGSISINLLESLCNIPQSLHFHNTALAGTKQARFGHVLSSNLQSLPTQLLESTNKLVDVLIEAFCKDTARMAWTGVTG